VRRAEGRCALEDDVQEFRRFHETLVLDDIGMLAEFSRLTKEDGRAYRNIH